MPNQRFHEIDLLRGLACIAVVAYHYLWRGQDAGWISHHTYPAVEAVARFGYLGVHLFFIISGIVIFMSAQGSSVRNFVASRVSRLYPALWVAAPLTAAFAWTLDRTDFQVSIPTLLANMTMLPHWFKVEFVDGAYWSLAVELQFYLLVALAMAFKGVDRPECWVGCWLAVAAVNAVRPMYPVELWLATKHASLFCAGICFYLIKTRGSTPFRLGLLAASWVLSVFYEAGPDLRSVKGAPPEYVVACVDAAVLTTLYALFYAWTTGHSHVKRSGLAVWAGLLTYPVYLLHQNIGYELLEALAPTGMAFGLRLLVVCTVVGGLAWVIVIFVERTLAPKLRRWISGPVMPQSAEVNGDGKRRHWAS